MAKSFSKLKEKLSPESQKRIEDRIRTAMAEMPLAELLQARNITQQQLA